MTCSVGLHCPEQRLALRRFEWRLARILMAYHYIEIFVADARNGLCPVSPHHGLELVDHEAEGRHPATLDIRARATLGDKLDAVHDHGAQNLLRVEIQSRRKVYEQPPPFIHDRAEGYV